MLEKIHEDYKCDPVHLSGELFDGMWEIVRDVAMMNPHWGIESEAYDVLATLEAPKHNEGKCIGCGKAIVGQDTEPCEDDFLYLPGILFAEMVDIVDSVWGGDVDWELAKRAHELLSEQTLINGRRRSFSDPEPIPANDLSIVPDDNPRVN